MDFTISDYINTIYKSPRCPWVFYRAIYIYNFRNPNKKSNYYDRVYLCVEKNKSDDIIIEGFHCFRFKSFEDADSYYNNNNKNDSTILTRSTMIPICKWVPLFCDPYIINYKLKKLFWLGKHSFYTHHT